MEEKKTYTKKEKEKIAIEAIESGNQKATAKKYDLPPTTLYSWISSYKKRDLTKRTKTFNQLEKELKERSLEVQVLKELLKKTTQALIKD